MTIRHEPWPPGVPCWADLSVPDVDAGCAFYAAVLGWSFSDPSPGSGGFHGVLADGHVAAAIGPMQAPDQPVAWTMYLASDDVERTATLITAAGGTMIVPPRDAGALGRLLIALDPGGAAFGVWQAGEHAGAELVNAPGGLTWEDLRSSDPDAARAFYARVFGYEYDSIEMAPADYTTFHLPGEQAPRGGMGGFMGAPEASHWLLYFGVADTDAAVAAARKAGGAVLSEPFDSPFGRMAALADPDGAVFEVIQMAG